MSTHPALATRTRLILVGLGILALIALAATAAILSPGPDPASANPLSGMLTISAGANHTCAVTTAGGVKCWGLNSVGQLGDGTTTNSTTPVDVSGLTSGVAAVAVSHSYTCAVTTAGGLKCWGWNSSGQLGNGTTTDSTTPVDVSGLTSGVVALAAGDSHTCAITTAGGIKCWGSNSWGRLGDGTTTSRTVPVDVVGLGSGVAAIALGDWHTCALTTAGGVKCWGSNSAGQLGDGNGGFFGASSPAPVDVLGLASGVAAVAARGSHTCAVSAAGGLKCWGWNGHGQLGDGTTTDSTLPVDVVAELAKPTPTATPCSPEGCPPPPTPPPAPAMSLDAPGTVFVGVPFTVTVNTDPAPAVEIGGFAFDILHPAPVNYQGTGNCFSEVQVVEGGTFFCQSFPTAGGRSIVVTGSGVPPVDSLNVPPSSNTALASLSFQCNEVGSQKITLDGAIYADTDANPISVKGEPQGVMIMCVDGGDVNCDAIANSLDALLILQLEAQLISSVPCPLGGDVNGDGFINSSDALLILQFKAGLIDSLPPPPLQTSLP